MTYKVCYSCNTQNQAKSKYCSKCTKYLRKAKVTINNGIKECIACRGVLSITEFYANRKSVDGYSHYCKDCYCKKYRATKQLSNERLLLMKEKINDDAYLKGAIDHIAFKIAPLMPIKQIFDNWQETTSLQQDDQVEDCPKYYHHYTPE